MNEYSPANTESDRERNSGGEFVTSREPLEAYEIMAPLEPYATSEIADTLGWPRRSAFDALDALADDGRVRKKKPNPRRVMWIRPPDDE